MTNSNIKKSVMTRREEKELALKLQQVIDKEVLSCLNHFDKVVIFFQLLSEKNDHLSFFSMAQEEREMVSQVVLELNKRAKKGTLTPDLINVIKTLNFNYDGIQLLKSIVQGNAEHSKLSEFAQWDLIATQFIERNQGLVKSLCLKQINQGLDMDDMIQEGNIGLVRAIQKFNILNNCKFSTYATLWIKQAITRGIQNQGRLIRLPAHIHAKLSKAKQYLFRQYQKGYDEQTEVGFEHSDIETANKKAGFTKTEIMNMSQCHQFVSMSSPLPGTDDVLLEQTLSNTADNDELLESSGNEITKTLLNEISDELSEILQKRYGLMSSNIQSLEDIARERNVSRETIRRLEKKATEQLSAYMLREGYTINDFF